MKCPHCLVAFFENWNTQVLAGEPGMIWGVRFTTCPTCKKVVIQIGQVLMHIVPPQLVPGTERLVQPKGVSRVPLPPEVPDVFGVDYKEACLVLPDSEKASAALSRRCLQSILRDKAQTTKRDLADQIDEVIGSGKLPSHITEGLHAVRNIGNFAAHPIKSTSTGTIVDVEPGEAEWTLDVLESLFDFYFVQPALTAKRKADLNKKLKDAGKPEIK
jgi:hypothetical protein